MSGTSWVLWSFVSTLVLTLVMSGSQRLGLTRMSIPFMLGTMFTPNRDRARTLGTGLHLVLGFLFALLYVAIFHSLHRATWWLGGILGLIQALFVLSVGIPSLPGLHPRMASEQHGPEAERQLEPPGFFAMHYGPQTPAAVILAHVLFGIILGAFYRVH